MYKDAIDDFGAATGGKTEHKRLFRSRIEVFDPSFSKDQKLVDSIRTVFGSSCAGIGLLSKLLYSQTMYSAM